MEEPEALRSDWLLQPLSSYQPITAQESSCEVVASVCRVAEQQQRHRGKNERRRRQKRHSLDILKKQEDGKGQRRERGTSLMNSRSVARH
ncbi:hypothetical protein ROHU_016073 [Labeo rohita]|uniref:Uncharacterized protein n=1 Tax=Labeo rohita TaxID=84645 RepID=A0A498NLW1_LABRO|nr:hypothetical protein ROHU_016073 [Labeo rohita]